MSHCHLHRILFVCDQLTDCAQANSEAHPRQYMKVGIKHEKVIQISNCLHSNSYCVVCVPPNVIDPEKWLPVIVDLLVETLRLAR